MTHGGVLDIRVVMTRLSLSHSSRGSVCVCVYSMIYMRSACAFFFINFFVVDLRFLCFFGVMQCEI